MNDKNSVPIWRTVIVVEVFSHGPLQTLHTDKAWDGYDIMNATEDDPAAVADWRILDESVVPHAQIPIPPMPSANRWGQDDEVVP